LRRFSTRALTIASSPLGKTPREHRCCVRDGLVERAIDLPPAKLGARRRYDLA
jgi:hypothetical protein